MIEELKEAGLTESESKVYLCLVDNGPLLAGRISRLTGLHRRSVYDVTEMLIKKGLIGYILKNNRRVFEASNPQRIIDMIHEKEDMLSPIVSSLLERYSMKNEKKDTNFYRGKQGLKAVFEDQLNYKEVLILGASSDAYEILKFYFNWYDKKRKKKKVKVRVIAYDRKMKDVPFSEIRYLPKKYQSPVAVNIYGDNVAIVLWANDPIVIVIRGEEIADAYRKYFGVMWGVARS
jgi:sugar-specific transcriptional regulator TrmB